jgi:hypothetical protein
VTIADNWTADYARFGMPRSKSVKKKPAQIKLKWYGPVNKSPTIIFAERLTAATKLSEQLIFETLAVYVQKQKIVIPSSKLVTRSRKSKTYSLNTARLVVVCYKILWILSLFQMIY